MIKTSMFGDLEDRFVVAQDSTMDFLEPKAPAQQTAVGRFFGMLVSKQSIQAPVERHQPARVKDKETIAQLQAKMREHQSRQPERLTTAEFFKVFGKHE